MLGNGRPRVVAFARRRWGGLMVAVALALAGCSVPHQPTPSPPSCGPEVPGFVHRDATTDSGARLHYVIGGHGPAVMLLHGFPETWAAWRAVLPRLAREHTVIAVDLRGVGCSSPASSGYDKASMAREVHSLVTQLGLEHVAVVGHDMGAMVAYAYARAYRSETTHLVLASAALPGFGLGDLIDPHAGLHLPHLAQFMRPPTDLPWVHERPRDFLRRFIATPAVVDSPAFSTYARAYSRPGRLAEALGQYRALPRDAEHNRRRVPPLETPVLAVDGQNSLPGLTAQSARRAASHVQPTTVTAAGHYVAEEQPAQLAGILRRFLASG